MASGVGERVLAATGELHDEVVGASAFDQRVDQNLGHAGAGDFVEEVLAEGPGSESVFSRSLPGLPVSSVSVSSALR